LLELSSHRVGATEARTFFILLAAGCNACGGGGSVGGGDACMEE